MRTTTLILLLILAQLLGQAQVKERLFYQITVDHMDPIEQGKLLKAKTLEDVIQYFPTSWIGVYEKTEVIKHSRFDRVVATGKDFNLSEEQTELLKSANLEDFITIKVYAKSMNSTSNTIEPHVIERTLGVVPDSKAWYEGGHDATKAYLREAVINKMTTAQYNALNKAEVQFYINEKGKAEAIRFDTSSGDKAVDALILEALKNMPAWHPAINNGKAVKQPCRLLMGDASVMGC